MTRTDFWDSTSASVLFEQLPEAAIVFAADGTVVAGNRLASRLFEAPEPFPSMNVTDLLPQPERERLDPLAWMQRWASTTDAPELDFVHLTARTRRGASRQLKVRVARLTGLVEQRRSGACYLVTFHDVTAAEQRLRAERQAHRVAARILAISADAIVSTDSSFEITFVNDSAAALFGWPAGELVGRPLATLIPERSASAHLKHMHEFAEQPESARLMAQRGEVSGVTRTGEEIPLEASITKVTSDAGPVFSAHLRDLRPRQQLMRALEESNTQFSDLFDHTEHALALLTPAGAVLTMNPAAKALLRDRGDVIGRNFSELLWWTADPASTKRTIEAALTSCRAGGAYSTVATLTDSSGTERRVETTLRPLLRDGELFSIIAEGHLARA